MLVFGFVMVPTAQVTALERLADAPARSRRAPARRMLVVANPHATTMFPGLKQLVVDALNGRFTVDVAETRRKGHAIELCRDAAGLGYDVVVAFGGDGTVNEAANGLAGSDTTLTCLPGGATNVYCRMLGIPVDVADATRHLLGLADTWAPRRVDLGRVNDRWFTFSAGAGLDATVVERVDRNPSLKARFGPWYYAHAAISTFLRTYVVNPPRVLAAAGGRETEGVSVFVQNSQPYTYFGERPIRLTGGTHLQSGTLSGAVLTRANAKDVPTIAYRLLTERARVGDHRRVHAFDGLQGLRVRSTDGRPVPVQVDGDYVGAYDEALFSVLRGGLNVLG